MGLRERWVQLTEPKVKEITPHDRCRWFERPRPPPTSNDSRLKSQPGHKPADPTVLVDTNDGKSSTYKSSTSKRRGFSFSRRKAEKWYEDPVIPPGQQSAGVVDVPRIPPHVARIHAQADSAQLRPNGSSVAQSIATPISPVSPVDTGGAEVTAVAEATHGWGMVVRLDDKEVVQPSASHEEPGNDSAASRSPQAAVAIQESILDGIFELPATTPRSANFPTTAQQATASMSRKRSKSSASDISLQKRASWFTVGRKKGALPPLPDTTIARPTTAPKPEQPFIAELPVFDPLPSPSSSPTAPRESEEAESLLRAFPSVPELRRPDLQTVDSHASSIASSTKHMSVKSMDFHKPLPTTKSFSQPRSPMLPPDSSPRPRSNVSDTKSSDKERLSVAMSAHSTNSGCRLSRYEQRSMKRVTRFMELMDSKSRGSIYGVVTEVESEAGERTSAQSGPAEERFRNDDALAALEFGIGEAQPEMPQPLQIDKTPRDA